MNLLIMSFEFPGLQLREKTNVSYVWLRISSSAGIIRLKDEISFGSNLEAKYTVNGAGKSVVISKLLGAEEEEKRLFK